MSRRYSSVRWSSPCRHQDPRHAFRNTHRPTPPSLVLLLLPNLPVGRTGSDGPVEHSLYVLALLKSGMSSCSIAGARTCDRDHTYQWSSRTRGSSICALRVDVHQLGGEAGSSFTQSFCTSSLLCSRGTDRGHLAQVADRRIVLMSGRRRQRLRRTHRVQRLVGGPNAASSGSRRSRRAGYSSFPETVLGSAITHPSLREYSPT